MAILFAAVCAVPINDEAESAELGVNVVENIDEYLAEHPEVKLLEMNRTAIQDGDRQVLVYDIGKRVDENEFLQMLWQAKCYSIKKFEM